MREFWYQLRRHKPAMLGLVVLSLMAVAAIGAPWLSPHDPYAMQVEHVLGSPTPQYLMGTDQKGRDIFSRVLHGARISFKVGSIAVTIALFAGTAIGLIAAYYGGIVDFLLSRVVDVLFAFPDILLALAIMAILGPSLTNVMIAIGIVYIPIFARVARGSALSVKHESFVEAAHSMGVSNFTIIRRHILPNISAPLIVQATLSFAFAILAEAALSFLGLGVEPDTPSWGILLSRGKDWMGEAWWIAFFPGIAITLAVLSCNLLGDGLRDLLDPKARKAS